MGEDFEGFVTKYALTFGIERKTLRPTHMPTMVGDANDCWTFYHGEGREWHRTYQSALEDAELRRAKKIASLRKSLAAMERLMFKEPAP